MGNEEESEGAYLKKLIKLLTMEEEEEEECDDVYIYQPLVFPPNSNPPTAQKETLSVRFHFGEFNS